MAQTYFPFDSGAGANITQAQWGQMSQYWLNTGVLKGVLNELQVYADSTGMQVKTKSGQAWMKGHFYSSDTEVVLPIATADTSNPRIDRIIVRVDWIADTIQLAVLQGVPASSPSAPALTQNVSRWEISLAQVRVDVGVATIASGKITDERYFAGTIPFFYANQPSGTAYSTANGLQQLGISSGITTLSGCTIGTNEIVFPKGGKYYFRGRLALSGLNQYQYAEMFIRCYNSDGVTYFDDSLLVLGYQGLGGNYSQSIPIENFRVFDMQAGGKVQFFARVSEAPRTINAYRVMGFRIGD